jgi:hypothetical protein
MEHLLLPQVIYLLLELVRTLVNQEHQVRELCFGGNTPPGAKVADVEEWNGAGPATKTITVS